MNLLAIPVRRLAVLLAVAAASVSLGLQGSSGFDTDASGSLNSTASVTVLASGSLN